MNGKLKPNFFVVGAPKSGTTSLYVYLKQHPQIFLPRIKELNFFCTDLHFRFPLLSEQQFLEYYKERRNQKIAGEVSVWNLLSAAAARNIQNFNPDSKIIIMLRHPVDMMYALHDNHVFNDNETIPDFAKALHAQEDRRQGKQISPVIKSPLEGLQYFDVAEYSAQVKRYMDTFGKERVMVILFDDFVKETATVYRRLLRFLEVDEVLPPEFKAFNASKTTRSNWLKQLTVDAPTWIRKPGRWLFPHQSRQRDWLMFWLWKINTQEAPRKQLDHRVRKKLTRQLKGEIENLQALLQRDLSHWLF